MTHRKEILETQTTGDISLSSLGGFILLPGTPDHVASLLSEFLGAPLGAQTPAPAPSLQLSDIKVSRRPSASSPSEEPVASACSLRRHSRREGEACLPQAVPGRWRHWVTCRSLRTFSASPGGTGSPGGDPGQRNPCEVMVLRGVSREGQRLQVCVEGGVDELGLETGVPGPARVRALEKACL